ncbi:hypothetical protein TSUD_284660 [Trifolium subterraneum]|uniref:Integrase catalytic domain-containing protein n=1 Tax=Trifolium subterraneum TaxID=3900 RepID=A0A2Z6P1R1_TRISU|nr:hypothetical protein TSUD_284660 [Trifolium subterraneum]
MSGMESWETFQVSIRSSAPKGVVSLETVKGGILNEEMRRNAQGTSSQSEVLVTENRGRSQKKEPKGGRENNRSKSKGRYKNIECNYCHKSEHIQKCCYQWRKDNKGKKAKHKQRDGEDHDDDRVTTAINDDLVILRDHESVNLVSYGSMRIVDNGATLHVTPRKEFFTSYTSGDFGVLKMGNDGVAKVIGVGDICVQTNMGMQLLLRDVKHAPDVRFNLIYVHMLDDCGYDNHFGFGKWKLNKGIAHEKTPPKTPQLNGLAERMNRTLVERVRCMLSKAKLPQHYWGEALYTAVHVINLTPTVVLYSEVPDKIWFGKNVKYDHLRVFGCKAFVHVPKDERSKLDAKSKQFIFIGYGKDEFGYKFYDPLGKKLIRSRDVVFMKDQTIEDIDKMEKTTRKKDVTLSNIDSVRLPVHNLDTIGGDVQNGEPHEYVDDQQIGEEVNIPADNDEENDMSHDNNLGEAPESSQVQLRRSNRQRQPSTRYNSDEYVTLNDEGEPKYFQDVMESDENQKCHQSEPCWVWLLLLIYMKQPDGFLVKGKEDYVCRLRKSLYGLKQAPRQWYKKFEFVMSEQGYKKTTSDWKNISNIDKLKKQLSESFAMKDLGAAKQILGIRIMRDRKEKKLWMSQEHYIKRVLQRFQMENSKAVSTPLDTHFKLSSQQSPSSEDETFDMKRVPYASAVVSLMYAMVCTRPDIAHVVGTVSRFLSNPGREHWDAVKWILRKRKSAHCASNQRASTEEKEKFGFDEENVFGGGLGVGITFVLCMTLGCVGVLIDGCPRLNQQDVAEKILETPLVSSVREDKVVWEEERNECYSVKSGYKLAMRYIIGSDNYHVVGNWNGIWKAQAPHKARHLLWRLCRGCLPTRSRLSERRVECTLYCPVCDEEIEDELHIFFSGHFMAGMTQWQQTVISSVEGEAWTLLLAMEEARHRGLDRVQFESDSKVLIEAIHMKRTGNSEFLSIVHDILSLMSSFINFEVKFVRRQANLIAHTLARAANS